MTKSPVWATLLSTSRDIREIPTRIVREAGLEEARQELEQSTKVLSGEIERELAPAKEQVDLANQAIETTASSIAHQSVPFVMRKESDDDKPKEAEEVSNPLETDPAEEIEEMVERTPWRMLFLTLMSAVLFHLLSSRWAKRLPLPKTLSNQQSKIRMRSRPARQNRAGKQMKTGGILAFRLLSSRVTPKSFEKAIIEPIVNISNPDPLQDELIKGRPMTRIPKRKPGAKLPKDVPPPPVEIPDQPPDEAVVDEDTAEQDD
jgi:hypothetical protein